MFFDKHNIGFTNLAQILSAFRDKVEIKVQLPLLMKIVVNCIIDYENFINSEISRLYYIYEDVPNEGMSIEMVETALNRIGTAILT